MIKTQISMVCDFQTNEFYRSVDFFFFLERGNLMGFLCVFTVYGG